MRLFPPPSPVRRARVARALGRPRGRSLCFRVKSEITADRVTYSHCQTTYRRPTDDRQSRVRGRTRRRARAGRCAMGPMCPSAPRAIAARAARGRRVSRAFSRFLVRAARALRSGTGGASRRSRVVTTRSQALNAMPSMVNAMPSERAEHKTINYRI